MMESFHLKFVYDLDYKQSLRRDTQVPLIYTKTIKLKTKNPNEQKTFCETTSSYFLRKLYQKCQQKYYASLKEATWTFNIFSQPAAKLGSFAGCFYEQLKYSLRNSFAHEFCYS